MGVEISQHTKILLVGGSVVPPLITALLFRTGAEKIDKNGKHSMKKSMESWWPEECVNMDAGKRQHTMLSPLPP